MCVKKTRNFGGVKKYLERKIVGTDRYREIDKGDLPAK